MPGYRVDDLKRIYQSLPNLVFVGVMLFIALAFSPAFLFLMLGGELGLLLISGTAPVQKLLQARAERERREEQQRIEGQILTAMPENYKAEFRALDELCRDIEKRASEGQPDTGAGALMKGVVDKLSGFRLEYLRMLRAHFLLANRNYREIESDLQDQCKRIEAKSKLETSHAVRQALDQNLTLLNQRVAKVKQLEELVRLIEARLQTVNSSLQLIRDEVDSMTDVRGISGAVDDLLVHLEMNDELRSFYDETLGDDGPALSGLGIPELAVAGESSPPPARQPDKHGARN
jgi:hypothetical protein